LIYSPKGRSLSSHSNPAERQPPRDGTRACTLRGDWLTPPYKHPFPTMTARPGGVFLT
jgi:hypothetical protein